MFFEFRFCIHSVKLVCNSYTNSKEMWGWVWEHYGLIFTSIKVHLELINDLCVSIDAIDALLIQTNILNVLHYPTNYEWNSTALSVTEVSQRNTKHH